MHKFTITLAVISSLAVTPGLAQGQPGTVERGTYVCELPGDAAGAAGIAQPEESFTIESASRYSSPQGDGTYLRRGDRLVMTSGPSNGNVYQVVGRGFLRKLENGEVGRLRCVRQGR